MEQVKPTKQMPVERYSRVAGYYRPVDQWNLGKQAEYADRKTAHVNTESWKNKILQQGINGNVS